MADKFIRVPEKTHKQVVKIAKANYRGIGDQVSYWAEQECPHPTEMREERTVRVALVEDGNVGTDQTLRLFYCKLCRRFFSDSSTELAEKFQNLIS